MIQQVADNVSEAASHTVKSMADLNPFMGVMLVAIIAVMGWQAYGSHVADERNQTMQQNILELHIENLKTETERHRRIDQFTRLLTEIETAHSEERQRFNARLDELSKIDMQQFTEGAGRVDEVMSLIENIGIQLNEKLDLLISREQIRGAIHEGAR